MRITLSIDGGLAYLPAMSKPRTVDVDSLPAPERDRICALVHAMHGSPPRPHGSAPQAADVRTYTLQIDDGGRRTTIKVTDPIVDEHLSTLVQALRAHLAAR